MGLLHDTLGGMNKTRLIALALATVLVGTPALSSCGSGGSASEDTVARMKLTPAARVIDVRTPGEFTEGHVQGATNIDVESTDFAGSIASLDKSAAYSVYCRSGRRSAIAVDLMQKAGFTNVTDLGGMEDAAKVLNLPIVTG